MIMNQVSKSMYEEQPLINEQALDSFRLEEPLNQEPSTLVLNVDNNPGDASHSSLNEVEVEVPKVIEGNQTHLFNCINYVPPKIDQNLSDINTDQQSVGYFHYEDDYEYIDPLNANHQPVVQNSN